MKVKELIKKLQGQNQDLEVVFANEDVYGYSEIKVVLKGHKDDDNVDVQYTKEELKEFFDSDSVECVVIGDIEE